MASVALRAASETTSAPCLAAPVTTSAPCRTASEDERTAPETALVDFPITDFRFSLVVSPSSLAFLRHWPARSSKPASCSRTLRRMTLPS